MARFSVLVRDRETTCVSKWSSSLKRFRTAGVDECMLELCFRFLSMLEEEVYGPNSPIWDPEFMQTNVPGALSSEAGSGNPAVELPTLHTMLTNVNVRKGLFTVMCDTQVTSA